MDDTTRPELLLSVCQKAVLDAQRAGAEQVEIYASELLDHQIAMQKNDLDQVSTSQESLFGIRVIQNGRQGFATTNRPDQLDQSIDEAIRLAQISPEDPWVGLPEPEVVPVNLECTDPRFNEIQLPEMVQLAMDRLHETLAKDSRLTVDSAEISFGRSTVAIASSRGVEAAWKGATAGGFMMGMAVDGSDVGSFAYDGAQVRHLDHLEHALSEAFDRFATKALSALKAQNGRSFRGPVLLSPEVVSEFLVPQILQASSAKNTRLGRSPLAGQLGQSVASDSLTLVEVGSGLPEFPLCPFDREGQPRTPVNIIQNGELQSHLFDSYEGRAVKQASGGHARGGARSLPYIGAEAIEILPGDQAREELEKMDLGLIVNRFSGNSNGSSGDFSGTAKGSFLIHKGEAIPILETTISGNIWAILKQISGISRERLNFYGIQNMPWIRFEDVSVTAGQAG